MRKILIALLIFYLGSTFAFAMSDNCGEGAWCACPGETQCLGNYATCEEACGLSGGGASTRDYAAEARNAAANTGNAINDQGIAAFREGNLDAAIDFYRQALQYRPDQTVIYRNIAQAINEKGNRSWKSGNVVEAISFYTEALQNYPDDPVIRDNLTRSTQYLQQQQEKAREDERRRIEGIEIGKAQAAEIKKVVQGFSLNSAPATSKSSLGFGETTVDAFNTRKAKPTLQFGSTSEDLKEKATDWFNQVGEAINSAKPVSAERLAKIKNDPRMITANKEIEQLKDEHDVAERNILILGSQFNGTSDPVRKVELKEALEKATQAQTHRVVMIAQKEAEKKKLHRTIDTEIEQKK